MTLRQILCPEVVAMHAFSTLTMSFQPVQDLLLYGDTSTGTSHPQVPVSLRRAVFDLLHNSSNPGMRATRISSRFMWPRLAKKVSTWARECLPCPRAKTPDSRTSPLFRTHSLRLGRSSASSRLLGDFCRRWTLYVQSRFRSANNCLNVALVELALLQSNSHVLTVEYTPLHKYIILHKDKMYQQVYFLFVGLDAADHELIMNKCSLDSISQTKHLFCRKF